MASRQKPPSPFYPSHPVPVDLFVGRVGEIELIRRYAQEAAQGKPNAVFLEGDYGIGKTSLAQYCATWSQRELGLFPLHVLLAGAQTIDELSQKTVETLLFHTRAYQPNNFEKVRDAFARYVKSVTSFGVELNIDALHADLPNISSGFLPMLQTLWERLRSDPQCRGILFIIDEINGIADNPAFSQFLKSLFDQNAMSPNKVPLLLLLCGTRDIRFRMQERYQPVERVFHPALITLLSNEEIKALLKRAFESAGCTIEEDACDLLASFSGGFPRLAHLLGEETYYADSDGWIELADAWAGTLRSAETVGQRVIDPNVYQELRSEAYRRILNKLPLVTRDTSFKKQDLDALLDPDDQRKLNNFLQKMQHLGAIRQGEVWGEYRFNDQLTPLYIRIREHGRPDKIV